MAVNERVNLRLRWEFYRMALVAGMEAKRWRRWVREGVREIRRRRAMH